MLHPVSFPRKLWVCLIAGAVCSMTAFRITRRLALEQGLNPILAVILAALILLAALIYPFVWQRKEKIKGNPDHQAAVGEEHAAGEEHTTEEHMTRNQWQNGSTFLFWHGLIRYGIALDLSMFGVQKWFGLQASNPRALLDMPFSSLPGEALSWAYFGHSYAFLFVIGGLQVLGSLLLVFHRTKLIGVFILLPVMVNICLMNYFYQFEPGEQVHAVILLLGLLFLLLQDRKKLLDFFLSPANPAATVRSSPAWLKTVARLSVLYLPFLLILLFFHLPGKDASLEGKYQVSQYWINDRLMPPADCSNRIMTLVYLEKTNDCVFEYNGQERRWFGRYVFDRATRHLQIVWHYPENIHDTIDVHVVNTPQGLDLQGKISNSLIRMELKKVP